jgi:hypothetical protein
MPNNQVKSKQRVRDHGEVFTPDFIVKDMLDLVKNETERIESRFLEPACGDGNFLAPLLERKLGVVKKKYSRSQIEYERNAIVALAGLYGVELLEDNVKQCRQRLYDIFSTIYKEKYKKKVKGDFLKSAEYILSRNILWGNALTLKTADKKAKPIVFSQWSRFGNKITREDYYFEELSPRDGHSLFDNNFVTSDLGTREFDPKKIPIEFSLKHYLKLDYEDAK